MSLTVSCYLTFEEFVKFTLVRRKLKQKLNAIYVTYLYDPTRTKIEI